MCYLDARGSVDPKALVSDPDKFPDNLANFVQVYNYYHQTWEQQNPRPPSFIDWSLETFSAIPAALTLTRSVVAFHCDLHDISIPDGILPVPPPTHTAPPPEPAPPSKSVKNLKKRKCAQQRAVAASEAVSIDRIMEAIQDSPPPCPPPPPPQMEMTLSPVLGIAPEPLSPAPDTSCGSVLPPPAALPPAALPSPPPVETSQGSTSLPQTIYALAQSLRTAAAILSEHGAAFSAASSMPPSTHAFALWQPVHNALSEFFQAWKPLESNPHPPATVSVAPSPPAAVAPSISAAQLAASSAARAVSSPSPLRKITETAEAIAKVCPSVSPAEAIQLASRALRSPALRTKKKRARINKRAFNSITIPFPNAASVSPSRLPPDPQVLQDFLSFSRQKYPACDLSSLQAVRWIHSVGYRLSFSSPPNHEVDEAASSFFTAVASAPTPVTVQRYQIKSSVFFRRIPLSQADGTAASASDFLSQLQANSAWASVQMAGPPRLFAPKNSPSFGVLYVDVVDDAKRTILKRLLSVPVFIGTGFQRPSEVSNVHPLVPRCSICQRWGHSAGLCRSSIPRCAKCAGSHDERCHSDALHGATEHCFNCTLAHRADSVLCSFYQHRRDSSWIRDNQPRNPKATPRTLAGKRKAQGRAKGT